MGYQLHLLLEQNINGSVIRGRQMYGGSKNRNKCPFVCVHMKELVTINKKLH